MCDGGAGMRDTEYIICAIVELNCNFFSRSSRVCRALDIGKAGGGGIKGGGGGGWQVALFKEAGTFILEVQGSEGSGLYEPFLYMLLLEWS